MLRPACMHAKLYSQLRTRTYTRAFPDMTCSGVRFTLRRGMQMLRQRICRSSALFDIARCTKIACWFGMSLLLARPTQLLWPELFVYTDIAIFGIMYVVCTQSIAWWTLAFSHTPLCNIYTYVSEASDICIALVRMHSYFFACDITVPYPDPFE